MAYFFRPPSLGDTLNILTLSAGASADLGLWGKGPNGEDLVVYLMDPSVASVAEKVSTLGPNTRLFTATGTKNGSLMLEARPSRTGPLVAHMEIVVSAGADPKSQALMDGNQASQWIGVAYEHAAYFERLLMAGMPYPPINPLLEKALNTHFHIDKDPGNALKYVAWIRWNLFQVYNTILRGNIIYRNRSLAEAQADKGVDKTGVPYPAYTFYQSSINYTTSFLNFGPKCRAAMVLHEPVHYVDQLADGKNDFYEHGTEYATLTPWQAVHNPSSYASFAQHMYYQEDKRYGAGKPTE